ncbi:glutamine amidotransferase [Microbacterium sp. LWH12-1.2]|uniref:glutamine amidotransferase n=1 Tax=Microbacterium sp. LWH12-1.2 TaxID=3135259 RepID=UPI0034399076
MSESVRIVQLYPVELGITGDRGNVRALQVRLERGGVATDVQTVGIGEAIPADTDVLVLGNGPLSAMRGVIDDLRGRAAELETFVDGGGTLLAVGGSAELLSEGVEPLEGAPLTGLGIFPFRVVRTRERKVGYIIVDTPDGRVIGFEDHASQWSLGNGALPYGTVAAGRGSFEHAGSRGEIVRRGQAFATNVQGPVLPLNPRWTDAMLTAVTNRRGIDWAPGTAHAPLDEHADGARAAIERLVHGKDISSIGL